jgi:hypothetical protein
MTVSPMAQTTKKRGSSRLVSLPSKPAMNSHTTTLGLCACTTEISERDEVISIGCWKRNSHADYSNKAQPLQQQDGTKWLPRRRGKF